MRVGWIPFGLQLLHKVAFAFLILQLHFHGCFSLNPDGLALLAFRSRVVIDPFAALNNWDHRDGIPCYWNGVQCVDGRVELLNLQGLKLGGTLAPELGKLDHLKALVLSENNFTGTIPREFGGLLMLEFLDLRSNSLSGSIPLEISILPSLKCLLLCENNFEGATLWNEKTFMFLHLKNDQSIPCDAAKDVICINRKVVHCIWQIGLQNLKKVGSLVILSKGKFLDFLDFLLMSKLKEEHLHGYEHKNGDNLSTMPYISQPVHDLSMVRRHLLQEAQNLPAAPVSGAPPHAVSVPYHGSGSFAAIPNPKGRDSRKAPPKDGPSAVPVHPDIVVKRDHKSESISWARWIYTVIIPAAALVLVLILVLIVAYRRRSAAIGPWKTGLSGQLQKAFITGVPKLNRAELEAACEDFSNIIITYPNCTVFKGTLSSGVEIAVVSTNATCLMDWSEHSELQFRNKIDTISRINHKNFVNLLGYCQENDPFMRMMVFEYAPNGTLFEHLHVKDFEHLDWSARMRIIIGIAYCLQHMHDLKPAVVHPILQSSCIFITDDFAAKIADLGIFSEPVGKEKISVSYNIDNPVTPTAYPESNVYSFGILLLEVISGRMTISEDDGLPILDWATEYLKDKKSLKSLVDPSLKSIKDNELEIVCRVAEACIYEDPRSRPTMKEVAASLRDVLGIAPEAATPRLSPLWWAELEILSVEAS